LLTIGLDCPIVFQPAGSDYTVIASKTSKFIHHHGSQQEGQNFKQEEEQGAKR
jgi:hypothetical protein